MHTYVSELTSKQIETLADHIIPIYIGQMAQDIEVFKRSYPTSGPGIKGLVAQFERQIADACEIVATLEELEMGSVTDLAHHLEHDHGVTGFGESEQNVRWLHRQLHREGK